ncbi:MAG: hypothetical protein QM642_07930 [Edaphocola sp.]
MKKITAWAVLGLLAIGSWAFQANKEQTSKKKVVFKGTTFLADGVHGNGTIGKTAFDSLLHFGLTSRDSANNLHLVASFTFGYAERGAYEDSTGTLRIMTDYYSVESEGGRLPPEWVAGILDRTKEGDTATFFDVVASYADTGGAKYHSKPLKLIIKE